MPYSSECSEMGLPIDMEIVEWITAVGNPFSLTSIAYARTVSA